MRHGKKRDDKGEFVTLYKEFFENGTKFYQHFKTAEYYFNTLLDKVYAYLKKKYMRWRKAIIPKERLAELINVRQRRF